MCWRGRALVAAAAVVSLAVGLDGRNVRSVPSTSYLDFKMPEAEDEQTTATLEVTTSDHDKEAEGATVNIATSEPVVEGTTEEIVDRNGVPGSSYIVDRNKEANQTDGGGTSPATVAASVTATPPVVTQKTPGGAPVLASTSPPAANPQKTPGGATVLASTATPAMINPQKTPGGVPALTSTSPPAVNPQKLPDGVLAPATAAPPSVTPQKLPGGAEHVKEDRVGVPETSDVDGDKEKKPNEESVSDIVFPKVSDYSDRAGAKGGESPVVTIAPKDGPSSKDKLCASTPAASAEFSSEAKHCGLIDLPSKVKHSSLSPKKKLIEKGSGKTKMEERKGETSVVKTKSKEHEDEIGDYKMKAKKEEVGDVKTKLKADDDIGDYKMKTEETQDDISGKTKPEEKKDEKHIRSKSKRSVTDGKKRKTKKSNAELLNHLGLVKLKSPAVNHHRKRLASQSRKTHLSQVGGDSKMFVIKLPPEPYYFSRHDELEAKRKPGAALPVSFSSNGKPSRVYHWNIPLLKKMVARKVVSPKAAVFASDAFSVDKQATWNEAGDEKPFHRKTSYYAPKKASKEAFRKYFSSNGKPHSFYVMDKSDKKSTYKLLP